MDYILILLIIILVLLISYIIVTYNKLITRRNIVKDQFSQIDVQLKRRFDLIPNLIEIVKGYSLHENETFLKIVQTRTNFNNADNINNEVDAANELTTLLSNMFILAESYPDLKANTNFLQLQTDLKDTENKIAIERQFYNDTVLTYNNLLELFPSSIVASLFKFIPFHFFKIDNDEKENITVKL